MMFRLRLTLICAFLGALLVALAPGLPVAQTAEEVPLLTPVPLDPADPNLRAVGPLRFVAGYQLALDKPNWGGFSDLCVWADPDGGTRLVMVGDMGTDAVIGFTGMPEALGDVAVVKLFALRTPDGRRITDKGLGDAEAMVCDSPERRVIGFERQHRLWIYDGDNITALPIPPSARMLGSNEGIEGLARLADGRLFMIAEGAQDAKRGPAWVQTADGSGWEELTILRSEGFQPTGLATLPDGDVLLLERFYAPERGAAARLSLIRKVQIEADAEIRPTELARIAPPLTVDNFEGIAVAPAADGGTLVFLLSDDNFNPAQRTLLLVFRLER
jgi:hypothetical protein